MKTRIFILTLVLAGAMYVATDYLFIGFTKSNIIKTAKSGVTQSVSLTGTSTWQILMQR